MSDTRSPAIRALLFDLDGTLVQTREASWKLFQRASNEFSLGIDDRAQFFALFEDNFFTALAKVCGDPEKTDRTVTYFLGLLRSEYLPPLVPGMADVVRAVAARCVVGILSTNALDAIKRIVDAAGLSNYIAHVFAGDAEPDKRASIRSFLTDPSYATLRTGSDWYEEGEPVPLQPQELAIVTDTVGDVRHARECGIRAVGVAWGMHTPDALLNAGAEAVMRWPQEILSWALPRDLMKSNVKQI
jgi:phosphoglycolate phosphatase